MALEPMACDDRIGGVSQKRVFSVVLTGGPCAGKTSAMSWITNEMTARGWQVLFVSEVATELMVSGLTPRSVGLLRFESLVLETQIRQEDTHLALARDMEADSVLVVMDRGILDVRAYVSEEEFSNLLAEANITEAQALQRYDAVFHLVTAAKGAEEHYTLANNASRTESVEQAARMDDDFIRAWGNHPSLHIVDNSTDFEGKMQRLIDQLTSLL